MTAEVLNVMTLSLILSAMLTGILLTLEKPVKVFLSSAKSEPAS